MSGRSLRLPLSSIPIIGKLRGFGRAIGNFARSRARKRFRIAVASADVVARKCKCARERIALFPLRTRNSPLCARGPTDATKESGASATRLYVRAACRCRGSRVTREMTMYVSLSLPSCIYAEFAKRNYPQPPRHTLDFSIIVYLSPSIYACANRWTHGRLSIKRFVVVRGSRFIEKRSK